MAPRLVVVLVAALAACSAPAALAGDDCPGGCVIASTVLPRTCKCVVPSCETERQREIARTLRRMQRRGQVPPPELLRAAQSAAAGVDCKFCERRAFTYSTFAECMDGVVAAFAPDEPSISAASYPELEPPAQRAAAEEGAGDVAAMAAPLAACPPLPVAGCPDLSSALTWESVFGRTNSSSIVTLPAGATIVLHGCAQPNSTAVAKNITVPSGSTLIIGDSPLTLKFERLLVGGVFQMGTPDCPITSGITVQVPGGTETFGVDVLAGGRYDVHGLVQGPTWTRVAATVPAGATSIPLQQAVSWLPGDRVVLVSTTWKDELANQNEVLTVASVSADGLTVTTTTAVQFPHYGEEYQAEVGLLTRRILFTSDSASTTTTIGPHTTFFTNDARVTGAAFERWAARHKPGKYPLHFHLAGNAPLSYLKNNAIYNSNWRCMSIHATNDVYVYGNVCFNVHGHGYYLEDGVEERNVLERNLAAYIHPINTAGSNGGQQGLDRWASATLFDPTDSGAAGFYSLNTFNSWLYNAASGGFAGFSFPKAPRAIKDSRNTTKPDGFPFNPSRRPFGAFRGNTAHSTGYFWEHSAAIYLGGVLFYRKDPADGVVKLFYNNGRGPYQATGNLCPDPAWPASDAANKNNDCWVGSDRDTRTEDYSGPGFLVMQDSSAALANAGIVSWGSRIEVDNFRGYDLTRGAEFLGQSYLSNSYFRINTTASKNGWTGWPFTGGQYWNNFPIKGFEWYDTMTSTLLSNVTFDNYRYIPYGTNVNDWWYPQTPHAIRMLSHSDQYKPDKTMMVTQQIQCTNCDFGTCSGTPATCTGGAFFRVDKKYTGASWMFNWLDKDGSVVRHVDSTKSAGSPYLITSHPSWWQLDAATSWQEPRFGGVWVSPMPASEAAARLEMRVEISGNRYTTGAFDGEATMTRIGYVSQFGFNAGRQMPITRTEGTTGLTGLGGWYVVYNQTLTGFHAPKRLELIVFNVPRNKHVLWASCWPAGTTFNISKTFAWATCQNVAALSRAPTRDHVVAGGGDTYFVDTNNCLHLKITDPGHPWELTRSFQRNGMYIEEEIRWYDLKYTITTGGAAMTTSSLCTTHFCALPGDPAARVPPAITSPPTSPPMCSGDVQPPGANCPSAKCGWNGAPACGSSTLTSGGYCQATCGVCPGQTKGMYVTAAMSLATVSGQYRCTASVTLRDTTTSALLGSGITVTGDWIKSPDNSTTDGWPYTASAKTASTSVATMASSKNLVKNQKLACLFNVTSAAPNGTIFAAYSVDWAASTRLAFACWDAAGTRLADSSCPRA